MYRVLLATAAAIVLPFSLCAQLLIGQDAYLVQQESRTFPNGRTTPARTFLMKRPDAGTYLPGRVIVKTRAVHGVHNGQNHIMGSNANVALQAANVAEVRSAFGSDRASAAPYDQIVLESITGLDRTYEIRYTEPIDPFDLCKQLMLAPDVEYAAPVYVHQLSYTPNDPLFGQQAWLTAMRMQQAWDVTKGSKDVIVAIVDSGTDWEHVDLKNQIWNNADEIPNNAKDDDGNGYVDDVRGWDFVGNITIQEAFSGVLKPDNNPKVNYPTINGTNGHGTVVAGCTGATTNNGTGVASTGFNVTLMPLKCGSDRNDVPTILEGYTAIRYAADNGAHIINCSWGGQGESPGMQDVIDYAMAKGALVVAASGNDGRNNDVTAQNPANLDGVLSVGASNNSDRVTGFSNYGWAVDVYAPGQSILSTWQGDTYNALTGTSFSSPLTAGVAALVKAVHPDWTPEMISAQIRATCDPLQNVSGADRPLYFGRVNAERAVKANASFTSGERYPGLSVVGVAISGGGVIRDLQPTDINVTIQNVLAEATNTTAEIAITTPGVKVLSGSVVDLGTIGHQQQKSTTITLQLDENFPWYQTDLEVRLILRSGAYINFARIPVPVQLNTSNQHDALIGPSGGSLPFEKVALAPNGALWACGTYQSTPIYIRSGATNFAQLPYRVTSALSVVTASHAVIGGVRNGAPTISTTTNGGQSWTHTTVSSTMSSVAGVNMITDKIGLAVGNAANTRFGIMKTTDGGQTWAAVSTAPLISGSETVIPSTVCFYEDALWFGTSGNRVIYTLDGGTTFGQGRLTVNGAVIQSIAFRNKTNGCMLYRTASGAGAPYRIATSRGSGATWQSNVFDPTTLGITPVEVQSPGGHHLLIGSGSEVFGSDNNGEQWQVILSKPSGSIVSSSAREISRSTLIMGGDGLGQLQYRYSGPNGTKILVLTSDVINYDTLEVNRNRQRFVQVTSTGESDVRIDSVTITPVGATPDSAFRITNALDAIIAPGSSDQLGVRMYATTPGNYEATCRIYTNGNPAVLQATLKGVVVEPVNSVAEDLLEQAVSMAPNPASTHATIALPVGATVTVTDLQGRPMGTWRSAESGSLQLDVSAFATGAYVVTVSNGPTTIHRLLSISR